AQPDIVAVRVEGHTDGRGDPDEHLTLSGARAIAVVTALTERGVDPTRLVAVGRGGRSPVDPANTPIAWAKNERIELVVTERARPVTP
ncbi:MAG: OmpA family protein, partial [Myxococcota bacterium]